MRATHAVAGLPSWSHVPSPSSHATAANSPPAQYCPALHAAHTAGVVIVAGAVCTVPGAQPVSGTHKAWLGPEVYVPVAHTVHAWSVLTPPAVLTYSPATHSVQAVQPEASPLALNVPLVHPVHVRSLAAVPAALTYWPATHAVHGGLHLAAPQLLELGPEAQVLHHAHVAVHGHALGHVANQPARLTRLVVHVDAGHPHAPRGGRQVARDHAQRGALARPVGAQEAHDLAARDVKADGVDGGGRSIALRQFLNFDHVLSLSNRAARQRASPCGTRDEEQPANPLIPNADGERLLQAGGGFKRGGGGGRVRFWIDGPGGRCRATRGIRPGDHKTAWAPTVDSAPVGGRDRCIRRATV